jgi:AAA15 family ATPase/GTPase
MKIKNMIIKNFKTFDSEGINLTMKDLTTLVGENNVGKSNVLEALDIFFNYSKTKINKSSFHHDDVQKEIVI